MATLIQKPTTIQAAGQPPKLIEEFVGRVNSKTTDWNMWLPVVRGPTKPLTTCS